jgi:hypothetical protein
MPVAAPDPVAELAEGSSRAVPWARSTAMPWPHATVMPRLPSGVPPLSSAATVHVPPPGPSPRRRHDLAPQHTPPPPRSLRLQRATMNGAEKGREEMVRLVCLSLDQDFRRSVLLLEGYFGSAKKTDGRTQRHKWQCHFRKEIKLISLYVKLGRTFF